MSAMFFFILKIRHFFFFCGLRDRRGFMDKYVKRTLVFYIFVLLFCRRHAGRAMAGAAEISALIPVFFRG